MAQEIRVAKFGGTPAEMALWAETELRDRNGMAPERVVARTLSHTFEENGVDHVIKYDLPECPSSILTGGVGCGDLSSRGDFGDWLFNHHADKAAADANVLLMDKPGGGCAIGKYGTASARGIDHDPGHYVKNDDTSWGEHIGSAMHEIGHMVGVHHDPHAGVGWNDHDAQKWHRTPTQNKPNTTNLCGEQIPARQYNEKVTELWYNECFYEQWSLQDKPPLVECVDRHDCPDGQVCRDNECVSAPTPCEDDVDAAQNASTTGKTCYSVERELQCPHDNGVSYVAPNVCEIEYLLSRGWTLLNQSPCNADVLDAARAASDTMNCSDTNVILECPYDATDVFSPHDACVADELRSLGWMERSTDPTCDEIECPPDEECVDGECVPLPDDGTDDVILRGAIAALGLGVGLSALRDYLE